MRLRFKFLVDLSWIRLILLIPLILVIIGLGITFTGGDFMNPAFVDAYAAVTGASQHIVAIVQSDFRGTQLWGHVDIEGLPDPQPLDAELDGEHIDAMVRKAVEMASIDDGGLAALFDMDDWICIKINLVICHGYGKDIDPNSDVWTPGKTTDLRIVKSFMEILAEEGLGNRITLVEGSAIWKPKEMVPELGFDGWSTKWGGYYDSLSYDDVLEDLSERYPDIIFDKVDLNFDETVEIKPPGGSVNRRNPNQKWHVPMTILNCDKMVSISNMKTHTGSRVTLNLKNYVGTAPGKVYGFPKGLIHKNKIIDEVIVDLFSFHPADFSVIGGIIGVEGNGPQNGDDVRRNLVVAGKDPLAVDAVGTAVMGMNPWDVEYFHLAAQKGFGTFDLDSMEIRGHTLKEARRPMKKPPYKNNFYYGRGIRKWLINGFHEGAGLNDMPLEDEQDLYPEPEDEEGGKIWEEYISPEDYVDLKKYFKYKAVNGICYAYTQFLSSVEEKGYLWVDGEKGLKIWLNGEEVYTNDSLEKYSLVKDKVPIQVTRGYNYLLVKAGSTFGSFGFRVQIVDSDNDGDTMMGLKFLEP